MKATIYHNPSCSKSCSALARLQEAGADITVVEYLDQTPTVDQLRVLIAEAGLSVRQVVRDQEPEYRSLGLEGADDEALLAAMVAHPRLIQRPFVATDRGTRMARDGGTLDVLLADPRP